MKKLSRMGAVLCAVLALPIAALAADKSFDGPSGWNHVTMGTPGAVRTQDVWKSGDAPTSDVLTVLTDTSIPFDAAIEAVRTNTKANGLKLNIDADKTCNGKKAHIFEMTFGTEKRTFVNQTLVEDGTGSMRITYSRLDTQPFSNDVKAALFAYCGA